MKNLSFISVAPVTDGAWQFILHHPSIVLVLGIAGIVVTLMLWRNRHNALPNNHL